MLIDTLPSRVYYVTPEQTDTDDGVQGLVRAAIEAGAGMVQYRPKHLPTRDMVEQATGLVRITRASRVPLIINDRVDLALAVGADGVHLGADDMPIGHARRMLGPAAVIGATVHGVADTRIAQDEGATYLLVGPLNPDETDEPTDARSARLEQIRTLAQLPLVIHTPFDETVLNHLVQLGVQMVCVAAGGHDPAAVAAAVRQSVELTREHLEPRHVAP